MLSVDIKYSMRDLICDVLLRRYDPWRFRMGYKV